MKSEKPRHPTVEDSLELAKDGGWEKAGLKFDPFENMPKDASQLAKILDGYGFRDKRGHKLHMTLHFLALVRLAMRGEASA